MTPVPTPDAVEAMRVAGDTIDRQVALIAELQKERAEQYARAVVASFPERYELEGN